MKKYKNYLLIWWAVILLWLLIYFLVPHVRFWTLYWLDNTQKDRFWSITADYNYKYKYDLYNETYRTTKINNYIADKFMLVELNSKNYPDFTEWLQQFLKDYNLEYYYQRYVQKADKTIFKKVDQVIEKIYG